MIYIDLLSPEKGIARALVNHELNQIITRIQEGAREFNGRKWAMTDGPHYVISGYESKLKEDENEEVVSYTKFPHLVYSGKQGLANIIEMPMSEYFEACDKHSNELRDTGRVIGPHGIMTVPISGCATYEKPIEFINPDEHQWTVVSAFQIPKHLVQLRIEASNRNLLGFFVKCGPEDFSFVEILPPITGLTNETICTHITRMNPFHGFGPDLSIGPVIDPRYMMSLSLQINRIPENDKILVAGIIRDAISNPDE